MYSTQREHRPEREDPMGWIEELQAALECPALEEFDDPSKEPSPDAKRAAYEVAVALGRCRVFGLEAPEDLDGVLPPREAKAAAELATEYVRRWIEEARQLAARWDESFGPVAEALCCETLEACMESYFAMQAIMEALEAAWEENDPEADALFQAAHQLAIQMNTWSEILQEPENLELLSTVAYLPLLDNWRSMLAEPYKTAPPWWLDGTLEAVDREIEEVCLRTLPAGEDWRRLVQAAPEQRLRVVKPARHRAAAIFQIQPMYAAAAETPSGLPPIKTFLLWNSPDQRFLARLSIPSEASEERMLLMEFLTPEEELATELGGQPVWLGGIEAYIEPAGLARFPLQRLREQLDKPDAELILQVGPERVEWPAMESS